LSGLTHLFWDSCVFIRYLIGDASAEKFRDIEKFVEDAKRGERSIYFSTVAYAEIRKEHLRPGYGNVTDFFEDLGSSFYPIEANPNVMIATGELRSAHSVHPNGGKSRPIATPDAIHLMTCTYGRDVLGIPDLMFHSFDEGCGKSWEGRCVPILGFEEWFPPDDRSERVREVCMLPRSKPVHPSPGLFDGQ